MTDELLNKANEIADKIKKIDVNIERVEEQIYLKKCFNEDIIKGNKHHFFKSYLKSFGKVFFCKDKKTLIRSEVECNYPVEIDIEDEEFFTMLLEYLNNKKNKLREELDKL